ncbi:hypothetical protein ACFX2J_041026 [Malus domestica]
MYAAHQVSSSLKIFPFSENLNFIILLWFLALYFFMASVAPVQFKSMVADYCRERPVMRLPPPRGQIKAKIFRTLGSKVKAAAASVVKILGIKKGGCFGSMLWKLSLHFHRKRGLPTPP